MNSAAHPLGRALAAHSWLTSPVRMRRSPIHIRGLNRRHVAEHDFRRSVNKGDAVTAGRLSISLCRVLEDAMNNRSKFLKGHFPSTPSADPKVSKECKAWRPLKKGNGPR